MEILDRWWRISSSIVLDNYSVGSVLRPWCVKIILKSFAQVRSFVIQSLQVVVLSFSTYALAPSAKANVMAELKLPLGYHDFLKVFIITVLDNKPADLVNFAAFYFKECKDKRDRKRRKATEEKLASYGVHLTTRICSDDIDEDELWLEISRGRRKAIAAASVEPVLYDEEFRHEEKTEEEIEFLRGAFQGISILKACSESQMKTVMKAMFRRFVVKGEKIINQGDEGDNFYLIAKGTFVFHVEFGDYCIKKQMKDEGSFGELALLYDCPRTASVEALSDGLLWCLDQITFKLLLVIETMAKQQKFEELLKNSKPLSILTYDERVRLMDALEMRNYEDGSYIIRKSEIADCMYFLIDGLVKVTDGKDEEREITRLQFGDYFGEFALAMNDVQKTNVVAMGDVACAILPVDAFERLLGPYRHLIKRNPEDFKPDQITA